MRWQGPRGRRGALSLCRLCGTSRVGGSPRNVSARLAHAQDAAARAGARRWEIVSVNGGRQAPTMYFTTTAHGETQRRVDGGWCRRVVVEPGCRVSDYRRNGPPLLWDAARTDPVQSRFSPDRSLSTCRHHCRLKSATAPRPVPVSRNAACRPKFARAERSQCARSRPSELAMMNPLRLCLLLSASLVWWEAAPQSAQGRRPLRLRSSNSECRSV